MEDDGRRSDGRFEARVSDGDLLAAVRAHEPAATSEVAGEVRMTRQGADRRLRQLRDAGRVNSKKIGASLVWFSATDEPADETPQAARDDDGVSSEPSPGADVEHSEREASEGVGADGTAINAPDESVRAVAESRIREHDLPGSGSDYDRRVQAMLRMYDHLRENPAERVSKGDFRTLLDGVDVGYKGGFTSLWKNWIVASGEKPNMLGVLPGVETRGDDYVFTPIDE